MIQNAHEKLRKTIDLDVEAVKKIEELMESKQWSFSKVAVHLINQSLSEIERQRRKNATKKVHS